MNELILEMKNESVTTRKPLLKLHKNFNFL